MSHTLHVAVSHDIDSLLYIAYAKVCVFFSLTKCTQITTPVIPKSNNQIRLRKYIN